jgi:hypothetical protein
MTFQAKRLTGYRETTFHLGTDGYEFHIVTQGLCYEAIELVPTVKTNLIS